MSYIGSVPTPAGTETRQEFTATSAQTTFATSGYVTGNFISVYLNGVRLSSGSDFTATNGTDVVLTTGAAAGDLLAVEMRNSLADIGAGFASRAEVTGINTTGTISSGSNSLTVSSATGINVGDFVVGEGIAPGTTVSAISGTTVTLSGVVGAALSTDPVAFYISNKALSPGLVGGQLCRAWVNFNGTGTVAIRASFNVSSITDNGTSDTTITFLTAMPDDNYCVTGSCNENVSNQARILCYGTVDAPSVNSIRVQTNRGFDGGGLDCEFVSVSIYR
tara:strand:- start:227 stop:1057 length:831 start_codon:yes stop_codon:yes gene_type:complete